MPVWEDNTEPQPAKLSNEAEKYAVEARAETISFSWRLMINDDLDALSRRPQLMGDAAARTINAFFWQQVTSNPVMADGQTLFLATPTGLRFPQEPHQRCLGRAQQHLIDAPPGGFRCG